MMIEIKCDHDCSECIFEWRNAQYNPDCFLQEFIDFFEKVHEVNKELKKEIEIIKEEIFANDLSPKELYNLIMVDYKDQEKKEDKDENDGSSK